MRDNKYYSSLCYKHQKLCDIEEDCLKLKKATNTELKHWKTAQSIKVQKGIKNSSRLFKRQQFVANSNLICEP